MLCTDTLELITSKENAHSRIINSVGFNNDGTKIVSGCNGGTIKVWGLRPFLDSEWEEVQGEGQPQEGPRDRRGRFVLEFPYWKNTVTGDFEQEKPSGGERASDSNRHEQSLG